MSKPIILPSKRGRKRLSVEARFVTHDGRARTLRFASKETRDEELGELRRGGWVLDNIPHKNFDDALKELKKHEMCTAGRALAVSIKRRQKTLLASFGGKPVRAVTPTTLAHFRAKTVEERGWNAWVDCRWILTWLVKLSISKGWLLERDNPFTALPAYRASTTPLLQRQADETARLPLPTLDQINRMLSQSSGWLGTALHLLLLAGLRTSELRPLKWSDIEIDLDSQLVFVHVRRAVKADGTIGSPKSKAGYRIICADRELFDWLAKHHPGRASDEYIVTRDPGVMLPPGELRRLVMLFQIKIGIGANIGSSINPVFRGCFSPHLLRHAAVAKWIFEKVPDHQIMQWIGHANLQTTLDTYGYIFDHCSLGNKSWPSGPTPTGLEKDASDVE